MRSITKFLICLILSVFVAWMSASAALAQEQDIYMLFAEADENGMTVYAYVDGAYIAVYDSQDVPVWDGVLNTYQFHYIPTGPGTYKCVGDSTEATFGAGPGDLTPPEDGAPGGTGAGSPEATSAGTGGGSPEEMFSGTGGGSNLQVICVPWQGDPNLSHVTYNGKQITLQGTMRDPGVGPGVTYT